MTCCVLIAGGETSHFVRFVGEYYEQFCIRFGSECYEQFCKVLGVSITKSQIHVLA